MISYSLKSNTNPANQTKFTATNVRDWGTFCALLTSKVWSPIIWSNGYRAKANFLSCQYIVLDYDNGLLTLQAMQKVCETFGLWYILATTKSHQKPKVSSSGKAEPACDRFRLVLKARGVCQSRELYEYNMRLFAEYWPCDPSCVDGARFFWPCTDVWAFSTGKSIPWLPFEDDYVLEEDRYARAHAKLAEMGKNGVMPDWVEGILKCKVSIPVGERHKTCYRLGATWANLGWPLDKLYKLCTATTLTHIGDEDMQRALSNGYLSLTNKEIP